MKILPAEKVEDGKERDLISCPSCKKDLDKQLVVMRKYVVRHRADKISRSGN